MKNLYNIGFCTIILLQSALSIAQPTCTSSTPTTTTVYTPYDVGVIAYDYVEMTDARRYEWDDLYLNDPDYDDAEIVYLNEFEPSSSITYNCHGYSWHMTPESGIDPDLDEAVWINSMQNTLKYISDGASYKQVESPTFPGWIVWKNAYHSARTTSSSNLYWWRSKWGCGPLMEHDSLTTPFTLSEPLRFYKRCFKRQFENNWVEDDMFKVCKHELEDCTIATNVHLKIEFEDWIQITGTFSTGTGARLEIHPE